MYVHYVLFVVVCEPLWTLYISIYILTWEARWLNLKFLFYSIFSARMIILSVVVLFCEIQSDISREQVDSLFVAGASGPG